MKPFRTATAALLLAAGTAQTQGPDARVLPRGVLEVRALGIFSGYDERVGGGSLGGAFESLLQPRAEALTTPELGPLRTRLNTFFAATGGAVETASLGGGSVRALLSGDTRDVPITAALGLTSRLTVEATLPVTRRQTAVRGIFLEDGTIGLNPNAELNGQLLSRADTSFRALGRSPFLPVQGTAAATALRERLNARSAGAGDSLALPTRGVSITELLADAGRAGRLNAQEIDALTRRTASSGYQLGDVELGARFRLGGTAPAWALPDDSAFVRGFRAVVGARLRLPTGKLGNTLFLLEEPGLRGHFGLAGDFTGDWFLSRRWWVTGLADAQLLLGADVTRLAFTAENPFPDTTQTRVLRREPGLRIAAGMMPRYRLTNELSFAALYRLETAGATTYSGEGADLLGPIESAEARTAHRVGLGASYTTVGAYAAGRAPFPAEVSLLYGRTLAGTGGTPADTRLELGVRAYYPVFGRPRRTAPPAPADTTQ